MADIWTTRNICASENWGLSLEGGFSREIAMCYETPKKRLK